MKIVSCLVLFVLLSACASFGPSTGISTNLKSHTKASKSLNEPTFSMIEKMDDGETVLTVSVNDYGSLDGSIIFSKSNVAKYIDLIDEYNKQGSLAESRIGGFTKELGKADSWSHGSLKFTYINASENYLSISYCIVNSCLDFQALNFDDKNTLELKALLKELQAGNLI